MKSLKKLTLWTLTVVAVIALAVFGVACDEQPKSVSLTFETNGGTAVATVTVNEGETVTLPTTQKVGAEFAGWYDNADFNGAAVTTVQATENKTYYAKWEQLYLVTLNADGGSLETTSVYVKSGAVVYDAISALVPTKENRQFGAWLKGETELGKNDRMSAQDITLTAKYKVMYTVEMYEQEEDGEGYQLAETITEYEYAGVNKNDQRRLTGFKEVANDNTVTSLTIDEDVQKNVFKHYFDREQFRLTLNPNYPNKTVAENLGLAKNYEVLYGSDFTPDYFEFSLEGYYLEGWARSAKGEVAYATNYMLAHLENGEGETAEPDKVEIEQNTALFAVWRQGRTDMFGGSDYLYVFDETGYFIYLERGGKFFVGDFVPTKRSFSFVDDKDDPLLGGRLVGDAGYCYGDSNRFSNPYTLFEVGSGLNENVQVLFDSLNGITYTVKNDTATSDDSKGEYVIDENGEYVVTFTEGSLTGKTYHLLLGTVSAANSDTVNAFRVRNEEEYAMPELVRYSITNTGSISYLIAYQIKLDGYGNATIYTDTEHKQSQTYRYAYNKDSDTYALSDSNGNTVLTFKVFNHAVYMATIGYFAYNENLDKEFTSETGSLVLDGYYQATYVDENGNEQQGYYNVQSSTTEFGSQVINFYREGATAVRFIVETVTENVEAEVIAEDGTIGTETKTVTTYQLNAKKTAYYAEYYYNNVSGVFYAPLFVFESADTLDVYIGNRTVGFTRAASGTYKLGEDGRYVLTITDYYLETAETTFVDINDVATVTFNIATYSNSSNSYPVNYWYSYTDKEGETYDWYNVTTTDSEGAEQVTKTNFATAYTSEEFGSMLMVGSFIEYTFNGQRVVGMKGARSGYTYLTVNGNSIYFEIDEEAKTFVAVTSMPYNASVAENGTILSNDSIAFDGKGGATYKINVPEVKDDEGEVTKEAYTISYVGTVERLEETAPITGAYVFRFVGATQPETEEEQAETLEFKYIQLSTSSAVYIFKYDETYSGRYNSEDGALIELDGFGYYAEFMDADLNDQMGMYVVDQESQTVIFIPREGNRRYLDLKENKTFTVKGLEYGNYYLFDNRYLDMVRFDLDGYGNAVVNRYDEETSEWKPVDEESKYSVSGEEIYLTYNENATETSYVFTRDTYAVNSSLTVNVLVVKHSDAVCTFVNDEDWSILKTDAYGNATRYTKTGVKQQGYYTLVTDSLLYFVLEDSSDACVYNYDLQTGYAKPLNLPPMGYYTEDLDGLLFTQYGFAIFHNQTRYYYNIDDKGEVYIYRKDVENADANEYGFVEEFFGSFESEVEYNGVTYYQNDGFRITFNRRASDKDLYPVATSSTDETKYPLTDLIFAPTGEAEFTVDAKVTVNGVQYDAKVSRVKVENEDQTAEPEYEMYVRVGNIYFYIGVEYLGYDDKGIAHNSYWVTAMYTRQMLYSYTYLNNFLMYYSYFGVQIPNAWGTINLESTYDEQGTRTSMKVNTNFMEQSKIVDGTGEQLQFTDVEYVYDSVNGYYTASTMGADGYEYKLNFVPTTFPRLNAPAYRIVGFTRAQTLAIDGYELEVERTLVSDYPSSFAAGSLFSAKLYQVNGEEKTELTYSGRFMKDGVLNLVVRTLDEDGRITASSYYYLTLKDLVPEEEVADSVLPYETFTVEKEDVQVYYDADGVRFIEVSPTKGVTILYVERMGVPGEYANYIPVSFEFDEDTNTYIIKLSETTKYSVKIADGKATIETYVEPEQTEEPEDETQEGQGE